GGSPTLGLLAHELTHVVQQRGAPADEPLRIGDPSSPLEREAAGGAPVVGSARTQILSRADPAAVGRVMGRGAVVGAGIQLEATHVATVHPLLIRALAGAFDPAWEPLLDQAAAATAAPAAAALAQQVTDFLAAHPGALGQGYGLAAQALTNAVAARPLVAAVIRRAGTGAFEVGLAFMDSLVNRQVELLASQRDGAAILADITFALTLAPVPPPAA